MVKQYKCAECGDRCDDSYPRNTHDVTDTDRGPWRQDYTEYYCPECYHLLFPEEV